MIQIELVRDKRHPDYKQGIRGYCVNVFKCPVCNRLTNLYFQHPYKFDKLILACSKECAKRRR